MTQAHYYKTLIMVKKYSIILRQAAFVQCLHIHHFQCLDNIFYRIQQSFISIHKMKLTLTIITLIVLSYTSPVPSISFTQSYSTYNYSAFPNDTCSKLMLTSNYIFRLGTNNVISVVKKSTLLSNANLLNYTYTTASNGTTVTPNLIIDFDVDQNQTYLSISQTSSIKILSLMNFIQKVLITTSTFDKILFSNLVLTGTIHNSTGGNDIFFQNKFPSIAAAANANANAAFFSTSTYILPNVKNCKSQESPNHSILAFWDQYSNVYVFNCTKTAPAFIGTVPSNITKTNLTQTISFSADSKYLIVEADSQIPIKIVSLASGSLLSVRSYPYNGTINKAMFLDSSNAFMAIFSSTTVTLVDVASLSQLYSQSLQTWNHQIQVDYTSGKIYVCKDTTVQIYNSVIMNCSSNCQRCNTSSLCQACNSNYTLVNGSCQQNQATTISNSSSNSSNITNANSTNATTSNSSNVTSSNSSNNTNITNSNNANATDSNCTNVTSANNTNNTIENITVDNATALANSSNLTTSSDSFLIPSFSFNTMSPPSNSMAPDSNLANLNSSVAANDSLSNYSYMDNTNIIDALVNNTKSPGIDATNSTNMTANNNTGINQTSQASNSTSSDPTNNSSNSTQSQDDSDQDPANKTMPQDDSGQDLANKTMPQDDTDQANLNQTNFSYQTFMILIMPDGSILIYQITPLEEQIINSTRQALQISNTILQNVMVLLSSSPYIYFFLGNLQFFTVSSLYALLEVPMPKIIYETLQQTAASLNANVFNAFNIKLNVPALGVERVASSKFLQFGVSSLFLQNNYQYLLISLVVITLINVVPIILRSFVPCCKILTLLINQNKAMVIFGLAISGMTQILLPYIDVYLNAWSMSFDDKINQTVQFLAIGIIIIYGALHVVIVESSKKYSKEIDKKLSSNRVNRQNVPNKHLLSKSWKERDNLYIIVLNISVPILVAIPSPLFFLVIGQMIFLIGLYKATLSQKFKINKIILSIYPIIFHACFIIFNFSQRPWVLIITEISCILIYFIGSIHQLLTILFDTLYFLIQLIRKKALNKVQPVGNDNVITVGHGEHWTIVNDVLAPPVGKVKLQQTNFLANQQANDDQKIVNRTRVVHTIQGQIDVYNFIFKARTSKQKSSSQGLSEMKSLKTFHKRTKRTYKH